MPVLRRLLWAALAWAALWAGTVHAHIGHTITRAERYLKLDATEADTRFVVSLTLGAAEGRNVLDEADTSGDDVVSDEEMSAYLATWAEGLETELPIEVDGDALSVAWTDGWMDPIGAVRATPVTVEMVAHLPLRGREHRIVVRDRMVRREVFDRTDVAFRAHDGAELVRSGPQSAPMDVMEDAAFLSGDAALDVMTAEVRYLERSAVNVPVAVAVGLGIVLVLGAIAVRTRRARR